MNAPMLDARPFFLTPQDIRAQAEHMIGQHITIRDSAKRRFDILRVLHRMKFF